MADTTYSNVGETPLETAVREATKDRDAVQVLREEREADTVISDIDSYVAQTDPASLPDAEQALNDWEIPSDPLDGVPDNVAVAPGVEGEPLVSVFAAQTESEANIIRGLLEAAGIPVAFDGLSAPIMGSIFQTGEARWSDILVPARLADQARTTIAEAQTAFQNLPIDTP